MGRPGWSFDRREDRAALLRVWLIPGTLDQLWKVQWRIRGTPSVFRPEPVLEKWRPAATRIESNKPLSLMAFGAPGPPPSPRATPRPPATAAPVSTLTPF